VQRAIVDELQRGRVPYVVLWVGYDDYLEPNESASSSGVTLLDSFLAARYQAVRAFGSYRVLKLIQ
jgi:hypothetical protein